MTSEIDHEFTDDVVCPHCGQTHNGDSVFDGSSSDMTTQDCDECGRTFSVQRDWSVCYITRLLAAQEGTDAT